MKRIKKNILFLLFILLIIPFSLSKVQADSFSCSEIKDKVDKYNEVTSKIESLECSKSTKIATTTECNTLSLEKNMLLVEIFEINDMKTDCDKSLIEPIVKENKNKCSNELSSTINSVASLMLKNFYVVGTLLFIIFGSLDWFKSVVNSDPKDIPKNRKNFLKRSIALVLLYLLPLIINLIFTFLPTHYRLGTDKYVCNAKTYYTQGANTISGYYSKDLITTSPGGSAKGKAIAEAAKSIKQDAINNGYTWGCNGGPVDLQGSSTYKKMCCAEVLGAALYRAGIYDKSGASAYQTASAPGLGNLLKNKGWILITDSKQLQPGDVIFYEKLAKQWEASTVNINGKDIHICHTDIYYGNGKKVSTGGGFIQKNLLQNYSDNSECYSVSDRFAFAFRFPGKK